VQLAGQVGADADGSFPDTVEAQFENAMAACTGLLGRIGGSADDVLKITYYLTEQPADLSRVRGAIAKAFGGTPPVATYLIVAGLAAPDRKVEIDIMAALPA